MTQIKRVSLNVLLIVVSFGVSLVCAELLLHRIDPRHPPVAAKLFYEHDDLLGWHMIPNEEGLLIQTEYTVHKKINSRRLRGPEWPYQKPIAGLYRILCLGDSYCEGYSVDLCDLFTERLQNLLNGLEDGARYEVINGGTGGYSTDQELLFFETEGYKYQPDLVVLLIYYNDVAVNTQDTYWDASKPLFMLEGDELRLTNTPVPKANREEAPTSRSVGEWLKSNSRIFSFLADGVGQIAQFRASESDTLPPMPPSYREFIVFQSSPLPETLDAWRLTEALFGRLKEQVDSIGAELLIFRVPFKATVYRDEFESLRRRWRIPGELCDPDRPRKDLAAVCERLSIPLIDPQKRFREQAEVLGLQGKRLYFVLDDHWTPEGNELVANILFDHIVINHLGG